MDPDDLALMRRMDELYTASPFHGSRRMVAVLRRDGWTVNRKRVRRLMRLGMAQYGSFRRLYADDIRHLGGWLTRPGLHLVAAQLAFDAARVLPATAALHAFFQDFLQHLAMQGGTAPRGEKPRTAAGDVGSLAPRAQTTIGQDLHWPATPLRASARAPQSAPAADPRPPDAPSPGSRCAAPSARRADAS
ncbi:hypothetical protein CCS01_14125 [Rhodopila globiformis]|uniref:HTH-like domain-containing protein n=1 Tax=Rhodopila globiformis TaxID=1071 RepID=A0A2S6NG19_RHOGL|nr:hypothetical protein CCS01_14125 [Rhodopila globiformis]